MASQRPPWLRFMRPSTAALQPTIPIRARPPPPPQAAPLQQPPPPPPPAQTQEPPPPPSPPPKSRTRSPEKQRSPAQRSPTPPPPPPPRRASPPADKTQPAESPPHSPPRPSSPPATKTRPVSPTPPLNADAPPSLSPNAAAKPPWSPIVEKKRTPAQSPEAKVDPPPRARHPSPLMLPPAHITETEFEQKNVLVQDTISKPHAADKTHHDIQFPGNNHSRNNNNNNNNKNIAANGKQALKEKSGMRVITLAGENKGAAMELKMNPNSQRHKNREEKTKSRIFLGKSCVLGKDGKAREGDESSSESGEESGKNSKWPPTVQSSPPVNACLNSNVQGINNSIVLDSIYRHRDPGVHFSLARNTSGGGGGSSKEHSNQYHHG